MLSSNNMEENTTNTNKSCSFASPTFSSHGKRRMSRLAKLEEWRAKNRTNCKVCSSSPQPLQRRMMERLSIQSIAERHMRKNQLPQLINFREHDVEVSPLSTDLSTAVYYDTSVSSPEREESVVEEEDSPQHTLSASGFYEEEEENINNSQKPYDDSAKNPKQLSLAVNLFPRPTTTKGGEPRGTSQNISSPPRSSSSSSATRNHSNEKENHHGQKQRQQEKPTLRANQRNLFQPPPTQRRSLLLQQSRSMTMLQQSRSMTKAGTTTGAEYTSRSRNPRYHEYNSRTLPMVVVSATTSTTTTTKQRASVTAAKCSSSTKQDKDTKRLGMGNRCEASSTRGLLCVDDKTMMCSSNRYYASHQPSVVDGPINDECRVQPTDPMPEPMVPANSDDDRNSWFPESDYDILSKYDELVRSFYAELAAERESSEEDDDPLRQQKYITLEDECLITESSMRFYREFNISDCLLEIASLTSFEDKNNGDDEDNSLGMFDHRRHCNISLHPHQDAALCNTVSTNPSPLNSNDTGATSKTKPSPLITRDDDIVHDGSLQYKLDVDGLTTPHSESSSSGGSSPGLSLRRRRYSIIHQQQEPSSNQNNDDDDVASATVSSTEDSCSEVGSDDTSQGQATVIAEERVEALLGGLPIHDAKTILTGIPENKAALNVDMVEHRRLAIACRKLRDQLAQTLKHNLDMKRDHQKLLAQTPKLHQQLLDSRNEVSRNCWIINTWSLGF
jgi:hypothetical protein